MPYSSQSISFRRDKLHFFSHISLDSSLISTIDSINQRIQKIDYDYLLKNQKILEIEFKGMFDILQNNKGGNDAITKFWLYCYYTASLLERYHEGYGQKEKSINYSVLKGNILSFLNIEQKNSESKKRADKVIVNSYAKVLSDLIELPLHLAKIRDLIAYSNLWRIYWVFCRLSISQLLVIAKERHLIDLLDALFGMHTDVNKILTRLEIPATLSKYLGVIFFLVPLIIDSTILLKHTFFPSELEKGNGGCDLYIMSSLPLYTDLERYQRSYICLLEPNNDQLELYYISKQGKVEQLAIKHKIKLRDELLLKCNNELFVRLDKQEIDQIITNQNDHKPESISWHERLNKEIEKRHCSFITNGMWGSLNFLTNFNIVAKIPSPVAGVIISIGLLFDIGLILYKRNLARKEYLTKKIQYHVEKKEYYTSALRNCLSDEEHLIYFKIIDRLLVELEIKWKAQEATFYFVVGAAVLLACGFTASIVLTSPYLIAIGFILCTIATGMYLSTEAFCTFQEKKLYLEQEFINQTNQLVATRDFLNARNQLLHTLFNNILVPAVFISTLAVCWPAALFLIILYAVYQIQLSYDQHAESEVNGQQQLSNHRIKKGVTAYPITTFRSLTGGSKDLSTSLEPVDTPRGLEIERGAGMNHNGTRTMPS